MNDPFDDDEPVYNYEPEIDINGAYFDVSGGLITNSSGETDSDFFETGEGQYFGLAMKMEREWIHTYEYGNPDYTMTMLYNYEDNNAVTNAFFMYEDSTANVYLTQTDLPSEVPEPTSLALFLLAGGGMLVRKRKAN
jgi:hypothetical protein